METGFNENLLLKKSIGLTIMLRNNLHLKAIIFDND